MFLAHLVRCLALTLATLGLIVLPLASPLLVSFGLILGGVLSAWQAAASFASPAAGREVVFRHYL